MPKSPISTAPTPTDYRASHAPCDLVMVRAFASIATFSFFFRHRTQGGRDAVLERLDSGARERLVGQLDLDGWVRLSDVVELQEAVLDLLPGPRLRLTKLLGRYTCDVAVTTDSFEAQDSSMGIRWNEMGQKCFGAHHRNLGPVRLSLNRNGLRLEVPPCADGSHAYCLRTAGFLDRCLELGGARAPRTIHSRCSHSESTADQCVWTSTWLGVDHAEV